MASLAFVVPVVPGITQKEQIMTLFGIDFNQPFEPLPQLFFEWRR